MASFRNPAVHSCPKCRQPLIQTFLPSLSFTCTNCGANYVGKQAPRGNAVPSTQKDASKQSAKVKGGNGKDNVLRLPSIKSASPSSVSCMCTNTVIMLLSKSHQMQRESDRNDCGRSSSGGRLRRLTNFLSSPTVGRHTSRSGHSSASSSGDNGGSPASGRRGSSAISTSSEDDTEEVAHHPCLTSAAVLRYYRQFS